MNLRLFWWLIYLLLFFRLYQEISRGGNLCGSWIKKKHGNLCFNEQNFIPIYTVFCVWITRHTFQYSKGRSVNNLWHEKNKKKSVKKKRKPLNYSFYCFFFLSLFLFGFVLFTHLHLTKSVNISLSVETKMLINFSTTFNQFFFIQMNSTRRIFVEIGLLNLP